jgi:hypothetical protein
MLLDKLKILVGVEIADTSKDSLLQLLIEQAQDEFKVICNRDDIPTLAENVILSMAVIFFNRNGSEGKNSESVASLRDEFYSGGEDWPKSILNRMYRFRKMARS